MSAGLSVIWSCKLGLRIGVELRRIGSNATPIVRFVETSVSLRRMTSFLIALILMLGELAVTSSLYAMIAISVSVTVETSPVMLMTGILRLLLEGLRRIPNA